MRADDRQPLGHPVASLGQVASDLGADAQEMERVRAPWLVIRGVADRERLGGETATLRHVRAERDAGETAQRLRRQGCVLEAAARLEGVAEEHRRPLVVAHPERHEAGVELCPPTQESVPARGGEDAIEPPRALLEALLGDPEPVQGVRQAHRLVRSVGLDEPVERRKQVVGVLLELRVCSLGIRSGAGDAGSFSEVEHRRSGELIHQLRMTGFRMARRECGSTRR